jgi:hypothetical protein
MKGKFNCNYVQILVKNIGDFFLNKNFRENCNSSRVFVVVFIAQQHKSKKGLSKEGWGVEQDPKTTFAKYGNDILHTHTD